MKERRIKLAGAALLLGFFLLPPSAARANDGATTNRHSLWRVEGQSNVVYLLGSIHLLKPEDFPLPSPLEKAFSDSQTAVFESDIEKMVDPQVQTKLMSKARLPAGETLKKRLSSETYAAFSKHAKECGLPMEVLESLKPSIAAMTLSMVEMTKLGADSENGLDKYFADRARKEGKGVIGLETVDFQIDLITGFSPEEDDLMMRVELKDMDKIKRQYGEIVAAWRTGDSAAIETLLNESLREAPSIYKKLVTDRNESWAPKIEELLRAGRNAVVIVGAGHLVGNRGLVELLKNKGLKVTQL